MMKRKLKSYVLLVICMLMLVAQVLPHLIFSAVRPTSICPTLLPIILFIPYFIR